jgi:hypothetical protein
MKLPARKFLLRLIIASLSVTAVLGIIGVLWTGVGETGVRILLSAIAADAASVLALCCTGPAKSASQRTAQVTGILSAGLGLATGICVIWWDFTTSGPREGIVRATAVLFILAVASAHACLVLPLRSHGRPARIVVTGTVLCTAVAAELIANYALFPAFDPGSAYIRALIVILILGALGTIVILLTHSFGPPGPDAAAQATPATAPPDPRAPKTLAIASADRRDSQS